MLTEDFEEQKARIEAFIEEWHHNLGLGWWKVEHIYFDDSGDFQEQEQLFTGNAVPGCTAFTSASWEYLTAAVYWNAPALVSITDALLEEIFVHECVHILLKEMHALPTCSCGQWDMRHEERVCTMLAKSFVWTKEHYQSKSSEPKPEPELKNHASSQKRKPRG